MRTRVISGPYQIYCRRKNVQPMTRFAKLIVFLFIAIASLGQDISRHDADSLYNPQLVNHKYAAPESFWCGYG